MSVEKCLDQCEDAEPIAQELAPGSSVVGAFDGLGGAGATVINRDSEPRTAAYFASRLARTVSLKVLMETVKSETKQPQDTDRNGEDLAKALTDGLKHEFRKVAEEVGGSSSRFRGGLIRPLPTTLALGLVHLHDGAPTLHVLWAGDSRVYVLLPREGLHQLTVDDLKSRGDAMRNLLEDSPMSNLVSADGRFSLNSQTVPLPLPAVVIAATDGCFGYLPTPAHFEELLLSSMHEVADGGGAWPAWGIELTERLLHSTGDDSTMGMACLGWSSFHDMTAQFADRRARVAWMTHEVTQAADAHHDACQAAARAKSLYDKALQDLWKAYKPNYERLVQPVQTPATTRSEQPAAPSGSAPPLPAAGPVAQEGRGRRHDAAPMRSIAAAGPSLEQAEGKDLSNPPISDRQPDEPDGFRSASSLGSAPPPHHLGSKEPSAPDVSGSGTRERGDTP
ncbi:hypothetical protein [Streptomyces sp. NPDC057403]|uniref:hypothetical protein n=1 Tax=Streptomyces sp. NPDC057403 TaxID=3346119 RepID=UPI0036816F9D